ncbi:MAG: sulfurtransferase TusA family protein [Fimbriimonadales bacterium]|nr:sulfurtransferase TusA family protein [Fimbriimonadales bacterium]
MREETMHYDEELDARDLVCPMPLVKARQAIPGSGAGENPASGCHRPGLPQRLPGMG